MKKLKYIFLLLVTFGFAQKPTNSELAKQKYQKVRIYFSSNSELQQIIRENEIDHFHQKKGLYIECELPKKSVENLLISGKTINVLIDDMQAFVQQNINERIQNPLCNVDIPIADPINYNIGSLAGFLTFEECMAELDEMRTLYPNLITAKSNIGTFLTTENRALQFVKISDNPNVDETEKRILFSAVHHAREPGSMQQLIYFMWHLLENYNINLEIKNLVDNTEIFCIPIVNPDGYIFNQANPSTGGGLWRKNRKDNLDGNFGVDNNRNYDYQWGTTGITFDTSGQTYCGTAAFSETENQAVKWLCEQKNFLVALNAHTYSSLVLYPYGTEVNLPTPDDNIFKGISDEMVKFNKYTNQLSAALYPTSGTSDDWMYGNVSTKPKIFAFTPEVGTSFWDTPAKTEINNRDMLYTNLTALRFLHNYATITDKTENIISTNIFQFNYSLKRLGLVENENFTVTIVPNSLNILSVSGANTHSGLIYNTDSNDNFTINLNSDINQGDIINFDVVVNNGQYSKSYPISKIFGTKNIVFNELGNTISQWTTSAVPWSTTTTTFFSANSSITDSPVGEYSNNSNKWIKTTNPINLNNVLNAELSFFAKWDLEAGFDLVTLEISNNNGTTWVPQCGKYTVIGTSNTLLNKPIYTGIKNEWIEEKINLSEYIGQNILIRFRLKSDDFGTADGFYFDDLKVTTINAVPLSNKNFSSNILKISPNPVSTTLTLNSISEIENYKIYNISGQLLLNEKMILDKIDVSFLSNGIYFLEVLQNNEKKILKFIVQK